MEKKVKAPQEPYNAKKVTRPWGFKSNNRLAVNQKFLADFMQALVINLGDLYKSPGTISYWFKTDDIYILSLKDFADSSGADVVICISKD